MVCEAGGGVARLGFGALLQLQPPLPLFYTDPCGDNTGARGGGQDVTRRHPRSIYLSDPAVSTVLLKHARALKAVARTMPLAPKQGVLLTTTKCDLFPLGVVQRCHATKTTLQTQLCLLLLCCCSMRGPWRLLRG
jgi:hypothetical protein